MARDLEQYLRPEIRTTPFCPGCGHGILMGLLLRAVDELELDMQKVLFVSGIGCAAWIPSPHFRADTLHTLHGRAVPFATGAKSFNPELTTIVVSGDGDLTSIGGNHLIHAARRDTDMTVICANNMIYGMTGGQLACTTPQGAKASTYLEGSPYRAFDLVRLVAGAGARYVARYGVTQPLSLIASIKKGITTPGFAFIEVLSPCPTQFGRRNSLGSPEAMIRMLQDRCISKEEAEGLGADELAERIVTGVFIDGTD
ncbi:MAG: 2-oxoacid:ferredoxin oxidoreductase subunit beta [Deltaproteobacteria bacterium]|nr:2-oxoacid:ferredoxin oxidoreductase subunit beta [Deltaproteobacteria bacterium]